MDFVIDILEERIKEEELNLEGLSCAARESRLVWEHEEKKVIDCKNTILELQRAINLFKEKRSETKVDTNGLQNN